MRFRELADRVRHSLWFIPTLSVFIAGATAIAMVALSSAVEADAADLPIIFGAGPEGARAMLQAIGGSVITVAGTVFSITIVALQLTSSQFSPRVLRTFLRDRGNQMVLGVFIGTFTYSLLVLRTIRSADEPGVDAFVPALAITFGLVLAFLSVGMLIFFIHHISVRIQVTTILDSVAKDTLEAVEKLSSWNTSDGERTWRPASAPVRAPAAPPSGANPPSVGQLVSRVVDGPASGYLQMIDLDGLVQRASELDVRYSLLVAPGAWIQAHATVAVVDPGINSNASDEAIAEALEGALGLGAERSLEQDAAFGVQQVVDIAVKALSPSVNDPTTAMNCIDRLTQILVAVGTRPGPPRAFADSDGVVRLEVPFPGFEEMLALAFDQTRHYASDTPAVTIHIARALTQLLSAVPGDHRPAVRQHAALLREATAAITLESERRRAREAIEPLLR